VITEKAPARFALERIAVYVAGHEVERVAGRADHVRHREEGREVALEMPDESVVQARRPAARQRKASLINPESTPSLSTVARNSLL
jgi:hypothetical protein